jgi:Uncharacterized conserved protein
MQTKQELIELLQLEEHVEGGWYAQSYKSPYQVTDKNENIRPSSTSIYFMLDENNFSALHRLQADEIWYFHGGSTFTVYAIDLSGVAHEYRLGLNVQAGELPQVVIPNGWIFGSFVENGFGLVGCAVSPGFDYHDFELLAAEELLAVYPQHETMIKKLTRI